MVRIVGGEHKGRRLQAPKGRIARPTSDRTREAIFNVLAHGLAFDFSGANVLDLFAGTGALGLEALSRGAARAAFVDTNQPALDCIRQNAATMGVTAQATIVKGDAARWSSPKTENIFELVFLDPPYRQGLAASALGNLMEHAQLLPGTVVVVETGAKEELPLPLGLEPIDSRIYGAAQVRFLRLAA